MTMTSERLIYLTYRCEHANPATRYLIDEVADV